MENTHQFSTDEQIWQSFLGGSHQSYSALYNKYFNLLYDFGRRLHPDKEKVKDCIQDVFVRLWNNRQQLSDVTSVKSYLFTALRNSLTNSLSSAYARHIINKDNSDEPDFFLDYSPEEQAINKEMDAENTQQLFAGLNELTPRQKECIYLRYYAGLEFEEIAEMMNITRKASYKLLARALELLKLHMQKAYGLLLFFLFGIGFFKPE